MAPFNTHFLIAEKIWPHLPGPWQPHYGQFCFGCVAPDVDKLSPTLTQKDTHFFDRTTAYDLMASHRTAAFFQQQADFLSAPFNHQPPPAQAFILGYLCHLCVDEVSKHLWRRDTWQQFQHLHPGAAFAALDESARQAMQNRPMLINALCAVTIPQVIPRIPPADLRRIWQGACAFGQAPNTEAEFMALVDMFDQPSPERRREWHQQFLTEIDAARTLVYLFRLDTLVRAGLAHSMARLTDLLTGRLPEPGLPPLD